MKKILNQIMLLFVAASSITFVGCKDDDDSGTSTNTDREFMTMFITDNTREGDGGCGNAEEHDAIQYFFHNFMSSRCY